MESQILPPLYKRYQMYPVSLNDYAVIKRRFKKDHDDLLFDVLKWPFALRLTVAKRMVLRSGFLFSYGN